MSPLDFLKRPSAWLRLISEVRATHTPAPNFALEYCLREDKLPTSELAGIDLSSLRASFVGAEPLRAKTFTRFRQRFAPYGLRPERGDRRLRLGRKHSDRVPAGPPDPGTEQASAGEESSRGSRRPCPRTTTRPRW